MRLNNFIRTEERKLWFMTDLHIGHKNVLKFDNRPFGDVDEMYDYLLKEILDKVGPEDVLFDLGDLFWNSDSRIMIDFLGSIKTPRIYKIMGNHDNRALYTENSKILSHFFQEIGDIFEFSVESDDVEKNFLVLSHFPLTEWNHCRRGSIHVHGHTHGNLDEDEVKSGKKIIDIGWPSIISRRLNSPLIEYKDLVEEVNNRVKNSGKDPWK